MNESIFDEMLDMQAESLSKEEQAKKTKKVNDLKEKLSKFKSFISSSNLDKMASKLQEKYNAPKEAIKTGFLKTTITNIANVIGITVTITGNILKFVVNFISLIINTIINLCLVTIDKLLDLFKKI